MYQFSVFTHIVISTAIIHGEDIWYISLLFIGLHEKDTSHWLKYSRSAADTIVLGSWLQVSVWNNYESLSDDIILIKLIPMNISTNVIPKLLYLCIINHFCIRIAKNHTMNTIFVGELNINPRYI